MIYTKKGDKGKTSLFESNPAKRNKVFKDSSRIQAIGSVDEANSYLGVANRFTKSRLTKALVKKIQKNLFTIGAILSNAPLTLDEQEVTVLEKRIDEIDEQLPPLRNFLLPEGSESAVHFMYARSLVRRAEREVVALSQKEAVPPVVLTYLNRLSDYLFIVFRNENQLSGEKEEIWIGKK